MAFIHSCWSIGRAVVITVVIIINYPHILGRRVEAHMSTIVLDQIKNRIMQKLGHLDILAHSSSRGDYYFIAAQKD